MNKSLTKYEKIIIIIQNDEKDRRMVRHVKRQNPWLKGFA